MMTCYDLIPVADQFPLGFKLHELMAVTGLNRYEASRRLQTLRKSGLMELTCDSKAGYWCLPRHRETAEARWLAEKAAVTKRRRLAANARRSQLQKDARRKQREAEEQAADAISETPFVHRSICALLAKPLPKLGASSVWELAA